MTEIQAQASVYTATGGTADHEQELATIQWAIFNQTLSSPKAKTPCGTDVKQENTYTNTEGGPLIQKLRKLGEEQERLRLESEQLRKDLENERAISRDLRRTTASARSRFFTKCKLRSTGKKQGTSIRESIDILEGNYAVGDLVTDSALFKIGELSDQDEFQRLYGVGVTEALSIDCASIIDAINKRASIIAEDEKVWFADAELETCFQQVLEFGRTASTAELENFVQDGTGTTDAEKSWFKIIRCPYLAQPKPAPHLGE